MGVSEETLLVYTDHSTEFTKSGLIVTLVAIHFGPGRASLLVGCVGHPSIEHDLGVGRAILYEAPRDGLFEVRLMDCSSLSDGRPYVRVRLSKLMPRLTTSPVGYIQADDLSNAPFDARERRRISGALAEAREAVRSRNDISPEQGEYVARKLDEIAASAERFGRRDWMNLAIGTLLNTAVSAALGAEPARALFQAFSTALAWLFGTVRVLP